MNRLLIVALFFMSVTSEISLSQDSKTEERDVRKGYIVEVIGEGGKVVEIVGAYLTSEDADQAEKEWNAKHPKTLLLTRVREGDVEVKRQPVGKTKPTEPLSPTAGIKGSTIVVPSPKLVDPGSFKRSVTKAQSLAGKKGTGTIGKYEVTIEFTGEGEKGEFTVTGEMKGKGKWIQLGPFVQLETGLSRFEGKLESDKLAGARTLKESGVKDEWHIDLEKKPVENVRKEDDTVLYYLQDSNHYADGSPANASGWYTPEQSGIKLSVARHLLKENKENVRKNKANRNGYTKQRIVDKDGKVIEE